MFVIEELDGSVEGFIHVTGGVEGFYVQGAVGRKEVQ